MEIITFRESAVPVAPFVPAAIYYVKPDSSAQIDTYMTSSDGTALYHSITFAEVDQKIADALGAFSSLRVAADIAARDALSASFTSNTAVLVGDATADATVDAGSAMYFWDQSAGDFEKIYEMEGLDFVVTWDSIDGRPTSTVADIDDAVAKKHSHANAAVLDILAQNTDGYMTYTNPVNGDVNVLNGNVVLANSTW